MQCGDIDLKDLEAENGLDMLSIETFGSKIEIIMMKGLSWDPYLTPSSSRFSESPTNLSLSTSPQALRDVQRLTADLPEEITGWLMLRRAALTKDQQHLVQSQVSGWQNVDAGKRGAEPFSGFWSRLQTIQSSKSPWKVIPKRERVVPMCTMLKMTNNMMVQMTGMKHTWKHIMRMVMIKTMNAMTNGMKLTMALKVDWSPTAPDRNPSEAAADDKSLFDVEEFDAIYSESADKRSRLAQLRQSRGF